MSKAQHPGHPSLYFEDFIDFYSAKKLSDTCSECKDESARRIITGLPDRGAMKAIPVPTLVYGVLSSEGTVDDIYAAGVGTVVCTCSNCGFMRLFSIKKVIEWKRAQEAAAIADESQKEIGGASDGATEKPE